MALLFVPIAGARPVLSFGGDVILVLYLLGLGRFFTITAAMDTASPFEGMGAAREAYFPIICEATLFTILVLFFLITGEVRLAAFFESAAPLTLWQTAGASLIFVIPALFVVLLTESSRVPVDDPATHLELTMIHEVMILDHSGPDLALIELGSFFKLFFYAALLARLLCPFSLGHPAADAGAFVGRDALIYVVVGVVESVIARYRMDRVPMFVLTSFALALLRHGRSAWSSSNDRSGRHQLDPRPALRADRLRRWPPAGADQGRGLPGDRRLAGAAAHRATS